MKIWTSLGSKRTASTTGGKPVRDQIAIAVQHRTAADFGRSEGSSWSADDSVDDLAEVIKPAHIPASRTISVSPIAPTIRAATLTGDRTSSERLAEVNRRLLALSTAILPQARQAAATHNGVELSELDELERYCTGLKKVFVSQRKELASLRAELRESNRAMIETFARSGVTVPASGDMAQPFPVELARGITRQLRQLVPRSDLRRAEARLRWLLSKLLPAGTELTDLGGEAAQGHVLAGLRKIALLNREQGTLRARLHAVRGAVLRSNARLLPLLTRINPRLTVSPSAGEVVPPNVVREELEPAVSALGADALLARQLRTGGDMRSALLATVRALIAGKHVVEARSLSYALVASADMSETGLLCLSLCFFAHDLFEATVDALSDIDRATVARHVAAEFVQALYRVDRDAARAEAERIASDPERGGLSASDLLHIAQAAFGFGDRDLAERMLAAIEPIEADLPPADNEAKRWLSAYCVELHRRRAAAPALVAEWEARPAINISVMDYKQGDYLRTSTNVGDYVQTIACLGNLARHRNVRFVGSDELTAFAERLRERVRPERRLDTAAAEVRLVAVDRDASGDHVLPERTWHFAYGWYMHPTYQASFGFPLHPHLRPIFLSFHVNNPEMLTGEAVAYLRKHGPIGCRDWTTTDLLSSRGVPAFFSGCLTTTIDNLFARVPERDGEDVRQTCFVDARPAPGDDRRAAPVMLQQAFDWVRWEGLHGNLAYALDRLDSYRSDYARIVTSRLHCYLPCRSMGLDVDFRPRQPADVRFDGLYDLEGDSLRAVADPILDKLAQITAMILDAQPEDAVYARWAELCAPEVEQARRRAATVDPLPPPNFDVAAACAAVRAQELCPPDGEPLPGAIDLAFACDHNFKPQLSAVLLSAVAGASRPVRAWVLAREFTPEDCDAARRECPGAEIRFLPCDRIDYGPVAGMLKHITVSTMDRLLLPVLLPEVERIIYIDLDTVVIGDLAELATMDLGGAPVGARSSVLASARPGHINVYRPSLRCEKEVAWDLRRRMHARFPLDFEAYNAGLLVLDLTRMRSDDFCSTHIPFVERYGMNDQEVLNCYTGGDRAALPAGWNMFPSQQMVRDAKLIHWVGPVKPWHDDYLLHQEIWQHHQDASRRNSAMADTAGSPIDARVPASPLSMPQ